MGFLRLFSRLIARPLGAERMRAGLTLFAVALGVAVVVAIRLAGDAATGSFRSSMETLAGRASLEIVAAGGVDEQLLGELAALPHPLRYQPRVEAHCTVEQTGATIPLIGLDLITQDERPAGRSGDQSWEELRDPHSIWPSAALGWRRGDTVRLITGDRAADYTVRGLIQGEDRFVVMDIGAAQQALGREGRLDRIEVHLPEAAEAAAWASAISEWLPDGVQVRAFGAGTTQNRRMLEAFRWNLRVLSYISMVVGAFLIYNTISVSVVRRRAEVGVLRALGTTRGQVRLLFLGEAALFGAAGGALGLLLGGAMARFVVRLLGATVDALYASSTPGPIEMSPGVVVEALAVGVGVALAAAFAPAREASLVPPVEAMARGQREHHARVHVRRDLAVSLVLAGLAGWAARQPAWDGKPVFGYAACFLLIGAAALAIPGMVTLVSRALSGAAQRLLGVEGLLAARSLRASLARTSVLVAALSTAVAMMVSVGIMVGSFRKTVDLWMNSQLRADLYLRPAGGGAAGRHPLMRPEIADAIERLPEVRAVDRFRLYEIEYRGLPALLGGGQSEVIRWNARTAFLPGLDREAILEKLGTGDYAIVSEPFANKHGVAPGSRLRLPLGGEVRELEVTGVYYDYSNERGYIIVDRKTLLRFLPDPAVTNLAVYLKQGADPQAARRAIERVTAGRGLLLFSNRDLRENALRVFDRTFAITWALEAIAILVAMLGIAGALLSLVIDRRREFGLLRFLGGSASQVRRLLLCEAGMLGLLANGAGLGLGWLLSLLLIRVINRQSFGWTIQFHWPVALLVFALGLVAAATVVAGIYPARVAVRLNPIEVIHEE